MILVCSPGELLARDAFMHYDEQGHCSLEYCVTLYGLEREVEIGVVVGHRLHLGLSGNGLVACCRRLLLLG